MWRSSTKIATYLPGPPGDSTGVGAAAAAGTAGRGGLGSRRRGGRRRAAPVHDEELRERLGLPVLEELEVLALQVPNQLAIRVGDDDVGRRAPGRGAGRRAGARPGGRRRRRPPRRPSPGAPCPGSSHALRNCGAAASTRSRSGTAAAAPAVCPPCTRARPFGGVERHGIEAQRLAVGGLGGPGIAPAEPRVAQVHPVRHRARVEGHRPLEHPARFREAAGGREHQADAVVGGGVGGVDRDHRRLGLHRLVGPAAARGHGQAAQRAVVSSGHLRSAARYAARLGRAPASARASGYVAWKTGASGRLAGEGGQCRAARSTAPPRRSARAPGTASLAHHRDGRGASAPEGAGEGTLAT